MILDDTRHLCGGGGSDTSQKETANVHDDFESHFDPIGEGDFILCHNFNCFFVNLSVQKYEDYVKNDKV